MCNEGNEGESEHGRSRERQQEVPQKCQPGAAIEPGSVLQRFRHREKSLAEQERAERASRKGRDQGPVTVQPAKVLQRNEIGQKRHLDRDDQRADDDEENNASHGKASAGEGESRTPRNRKMQ